VSPLHGPTAPSTSRKTFYRPKTKIFFHSTNHSIPQISAAQLVSTSLYIRPAFHFLRDLHHSAPLSTFSLFRITHQQMLIEQYIFSYLHSFHSHYSSSPGLHQTIFIYTFPLPLISFLQPGWEESSSAYPLHQR
jgi:hypothetical protein